MPEPRIRPLRAGGQTPEEIGATVAGFIDLAQHTLDLALYDVRLPGPVGDLVAGALRNASARGVAVRLVFNLDGVRRVPIPPPTRTKPELLAALPIDVRPIPGEPDLMHHKFVVRDGAALWAGSTNWTLDSWSREENVIVTLDSPEIARAYTRTFDQLWERHRVEHSGDVEPVPVRVGDATVRAWFSPSRGPALSARIAAAIARARRRVRIASPVITAAPVLATLAQEVSDGRLDLAGVVDQTQIAQVVGQWKSNGTSSWKLPLLERALEGAPFSGKRSTPYAPGSIHDYMHAKMTVADDTVFVGSFNLSHSGERNAESVLEIEHAALAERMAAYIDEIRALYPPADVPLGAKP